MINWFGYGIWETCIQISALPLQNVQSRASFLNLKGLSLFPCMETRSGATELVE